MNKYLVIEGIDGSGKSTLLEELKRIYKCDEQIEFVKSPTEPFDVLVKDIWDCPPLERFMFFVTSNLFFLNTADRQKNLYSR